MTGPDERGALEAEELLAAQRLFAQRLKAALGDATRKQAEAEAGQRQWEAEAEKYRLALLGTATDYAADLDRLRLAERSLREMKALLQYSETRSDPAGALRRYRLTQEENAVLRSRVAQLEAEKVKAMGTR